MECCLKVTKFPKNWKSETTPFGIVKKPSGDKSGSNPNLLTFLILRSGLA